MAIKAREKWVGFYEKLFFALLTITAAIIGWLGTEFERYPNDGPHYKWLAGILVAVTVVAAIIVISRMKLQIELLEEAERKNVDHNLGALTALGLRKGDE